MSEEKLMFGLKDQPIEDKTQEALGLVDYAEVLTEFIKFCDTPMTIALQGDWGSGKTSLMSIIKKELADDLERDSYKTVWFNTWQYSQFNMGETLALSMIAKITDAIAPDDAGDAMQTFKRSLWQVTKAATIGGASLIGQADTAKDFVDQVQQGIKQKDTDDPSIALERIKDGLKDIVKKQTDTGINKIVVFIDDLDRLVPVKAVELLEAMKILLDIDKCVFVIACDYSVVVTGLKEKFGVSEGELKGKSFFDKIIQVPFRMPIKRYQVDNYIRQLLEKVRLEFDPEADIGIYRDLVKYSVGFNPRTMKRLLNTLQLLTILDEKSAEKSGKTIDSIKSTRRHSCRATFGILCMQESYPSIFDYIVEEVSADRLYRLRDGIDSDEGEEFASIRETIGEEKTGDAAEFCRVFVDSVQLDENSDLSDDEISHLKEMLSYSSLVSTEHATKEIDLQSFALNLRKELNSRYGGFFSHQIEGKRVYDGFRKRGGSVIVRLPVIGPWTAFRMQKRNDYLCMTIQSTSHQVASELSSTFCKRFSWEVIKLDHYKGKWSEHFLIMVPSNSNGAIETYKNCLFSHFDQLTGDKDFLYNLCNEIAQEN